MAATLLPLKVALYQVSFFLLILVYVGRCRVGQLRKFSHEFFICGFFQKKLSLF